MRSFKLMGVIFLAVMVIIAGFGYRYYNSPAYSLIRIARAVEAHDQRNFDKYVDRPTLSANLADDLVNFTSSMIERKQQKEGGEDNSAKANMARMMAEAMKPKMIEEIDQAIVKLVEQPDTAKQTTGKPKTKKRDDNILSLLNVDDDFKELRPGDVTVKTVGDSTYLVALSDKKEGKERVQLSGTMHKQDGVWRLTDVNYLEYILTRHGLGKSGDEKKPENN